MDSPASASSLGSTPPPLEPAVEPDMSVAARISTWLWCFSSCSMQWTRLTTHDGRLGVLVELRSEISEMVLDEDDEFEHLLQLREAIDLVALTLAVEPLALSKLLRGNRYWFDPASKDKDTIDSILAHGARTELRLRFIFQSIKTRLLTPQLTTHFIHRLGQTLSTNNEFQALRRELVERLRGDEAAMERVGRLSIPITMDVDSDELETMSLLDADDFFVHLASFSKEGKANQRLTPVTHWEIDTRHVPLVLENIMLTLQRFCITHRVAQAAKVFTSAGVPVQLASLNLDPRLISCADQDVYDFVATLTQGATDLRIETGMDLNEDFSEAIDEDDQDRRGTIRVIMNAVAKVEHLRELNLSGVLSLCAAQHNRHEVWRGLFRQILLRAVPPETIMIDERGGLYQGDRESVREEAAHWRQNYPGKKLFIKNLHLRMLANEAEDVEEILLAVDDAESVELTNRSGPNLPPRIVSRLLAYPSLKKLTLGRLVLPSMDVFDPTSSVGNIAVLEELVLEDLILEDASSMPRFLDKLRWDPDKLSVLANSLRRFNVVQCDVGWNECYVADQAALQSLAQVLATNRVLSEARLPVDHSEEYVAQCLKPIEKHNNTSLPAPPKIRKSEIAKARNVSFLSVIRESVDAIASAKTQLDASVVSRIFEFAAPHRLRKVELQPWESL